MRIPRNGQQTILAERSRALWALQARPLGGYSGGRRNDKLMAESSGIKRADARSSGPLAPLSTAAKAAFPPCGSTGRSDLRGRLRGAMRPGSFTICTQHIRRHPRSHRTRRLCCIRYLVRSIRAAGMAPQEMVSRRRKASAGEFTCIHRGAPPPTHLLGSSPRPACGRCPRPARSAASWSSVDTIAASPRTGCPWPHGQRGTSP